MVTAFASCPNCGSGDTRRLEIVYQDGLHDVQTRSTGAGLGGDGFGLGGGVGAATTTGTQQSRLSQSAAPPVKYSAIGPGCTLVAVIVVALVIPNPVSWSIAAVVALICIALISGYNKHNSTVFPTLYADWSNTFMCLRCGNRFLATQERNVTSAPTTELPAGDQPALQASAATTDRFCTNCGKRALTDDQRFCGGCGSSLHPTDVPTPLPIARTSVELRVTDKGARVISAIATLRNLVPSLGLAEAKDVVEGRRTLTLTPGEAAVLKSRLEADGTVVSVG